MSPVPPEPDDWASDLADLGRWRWPEAPGEATWSPRMRRIHGLDVHAPVPTPTEYLERYVHEADRLALDRAAQDAARAGEPFAVQVRIRRDDGVLRTLRVHGEPDPQGGMRGVSHDITTLVESDAALHAEQQDYRLLADNASDAVSRHAPDGTYLYVGPAAQQVLGHDAAALVGTTPFAYIHPDELGQWTDALTRAARGELEAVTLRNRFRGADGHWRWVEVATRVVRDHAGTVREFHASARNIDVQVREERAREDADALLRAAFDAAPVGKAIVAPDGRFLRVNPSLCTMTGLTEAELLAGRFQEITHPDDLDADTALLARTLAGEMSGYEMEKRYLRPDGSVWWARLTVRLVRSADGEPRVFVSQVVDLTERRRHEHELTLAEQRHRLLLDSLPDTLVTLYDRDLRIVSLRGALASGTLDPESLVGKPITEALLPGTLAQMRPLLERALDGESSGRQIRSELNDRDYEIRILPQRDPAGSVVGVMSVARDVTEHLARERELETNREALAEANRALGAVLTHTPAAVFLKDRSQRFLLANEQTAAIVGRPGEDLVGTSLWDIYPADVVAQLDANDAAVMDGGVPVQFEERAPDQADGGREHTWLAVKFPVRDGRGDVVGVGGISLDITARRDAEEAQRAAEERFEVAFEHAAVPMALIGLDGDRRGRVLHANHAYAELLGNSPEDLTGQHLETWVHPDDLEIACQEPLDALARDEAERTQVERRYLHRDGHVVWTLATDARYEDVDGERIAVEQVLDISDRKHFEHRLRHLADHDPLTGLYNRRRFLDELESRIAHVRRYRGCFGLLAVDLDGFKYVNDSLGHAAGDELVARLAATLRETLRETDVIARTGGDEFAVILPETDVATARLVATKLVQELRRAGKLVDRHRHAQVTASIGITTLGPGQDLTGEDLLVEADIAMYDAKAAGKNRHSTFERDQRRREQITERQRWLRRLHDAVEHERFELFAQPIVPVASAGVPRFELLLRMRSESGDLIPPGSFLYNAERFDLIEQIDLWVMSRAVAMLHERHVAGQDLSLAINMSAKTIDAGNATDHLAALLAAKPINPERLVIEVTETAAITNISRAQDLSRDLRALRCGFALDDFGAGFATFYYLKHLAFDFVKIDGEFIRRLPDNPTDQLVVSAVVDIARGMGSDTIAEFVQDERTLRLLRELGVGYAQGFHTGRPRELEAVLPALC